MVEHEGYIDESVIGADSVGLVEDVLTSEELSAVLPKDVLAVYCTDGSIAASSSQDLLEV